MSDQVCTTCVTPDQAGRSLTGLWNTLCPPFRQLSLTRNSNHHECLTTQQNLTQTKTKHFTLIISVTIINRQGFHPIFIQFSCSHWHSLCISRSFFSDHQTSNSNTTLPLGLCVRFDHLLTNNIFPIQSTRSHYHTLYTSSILFKSFPTIDSPIKFLPKLHSRYIHKPNPSFHTP